MLFVCGLAFVFFLYSLRLPSLMSSFVLYLSCLPSALASVKTTTNFALDAGVLGLVVGVGEALDFDVGALFEAGDSLLEAGDCRVGSQACWREILSGS